MVAKGPSVLLALGASSVPDQESFPLGATKKSPFTALASNGCHNSLRNSFPSLAVPTLLVCAWVVKGKPIAKHKKTTHAKFDMFL
jgi:hypothetical protein